MKQRARTAEEYSVFLDFDNTITQYDVLDDIIERFSPNNKWVSLEKKWKEGRIGSKECLKGQVEALRVGRKTLEEYLRTVKVDPYFKKLKDYLGARNIKIVVLSDNFDYILNRILKNNDIRGLRVFSNKLRIRENRFRTSFPLTNGDCGKCGHCKKSSFLAKAGKGTRTVYVGDGLSDVDPAKHADIVFAKGALKEHFRENGLKHIPFRDLKTVYNYFKRNLT